MKKRVLVFTIMFAVVFGFAPFVSANGCFDPDHRGPLGILYLIQKDSAWEPVPGGAHGRLHYNIWGEKFNFWFEGHGLIQGKEYTLIYYPDPWPGEGLICLGTGIAHGKRGNVAIWGKKFLGTDLPAEYDANAKAIYPSGAVGAKIWLVLSEDVKCESGGEPPGPQMTGWNPSEYLFEVNLITHYYVERDDSCGKKRK